MAVTHWPISTPLKKNSLLFPPKESRKIFALDKNLFFSLLYKDLSFGLAADLGQGVTAFAQLLPRSTRDTSFKIFAFV